MVTRKLPQLSILDQIKNDPYHSPRRSIDWYKKKINDLGGNSPLAKTELLKTTKALQTNMIVPGTMNFFAYGHPIQS